jgi:hypothetical protein
MKARGVFYFGKFIVMGVAFLALFTYVVMLLWNWLVPELFSGYWSHRHPSSLWRKKFEEKMNGKVADEQNQQEGSKDGCC